jgi:signal peptidase II
VTKKVAIISTILLVLLIDQGLKIWVKTHMEYGSGFNLLGQEWARIQFVENEGMAFGLSYGGVVGKYILTVFRVFMACFLSYILYTLWKQNDRTSLLVSFSLIVAGAIGNIIDCIFYGQIFSESSYHGGLAQFVSIGKGYAPWLQGKVVDMLYFPMVDTILPSWVPLWGGERFEFFRPVFNIADSAITVGVISIILFNFKFLTSDTKKKVASTVNTNSEDSIPSSNEEAN